MSSSSKRILTGLLTLTAVIVLIGGLYFALPLLETKEPIRTHSAANARAVRESQFHDRFDPLLLHSVEIVATIQSTYGKLVNTPGKMSVAVLMYVTSYFALVEKVPASTGKHRYFPDYYRGLASPAFFLPIHFIDRDYVRPNYWKIIRDW